MSKVFKFTRKSASQGVDAGVVSLQQSPQLERKEGTHDTHEASTWNPGDHHEGHLHHSEQNTMTSAQTTTAGTSEEIVSEVGEHEDGPLRTACPFKAH